MNGYDKTILLSLLIVQFVEAFITTNVKALLVPCNIGKGRTISDFSDLVALVIS